MHGGGLLGRGVREQLDLVELVDAQQPAGVLAGRPRLAPEARRVGAQALGQVGLVQDLVAGQRRERDLGGGDRPELVALEVVGVVRELRQVTGRHHRGRPDERGRADLLVQVDVAVEGELAQRPDERGASASVHHEHRPGELGPPFEIEDAERLPDLPVRHPLVLAVGVGIELLDPGDDVVGLRGTVGRVDRRDVGQVEEDVLQVGRDLLGLRVELLLLGAELAALLLQLAGLVLAAVAVELAHLVGDRADPGPQLVTCRAETPQLGIEVDHPVDLGQVVSPAGQPGPHHVGLGPETAHVEHGRSR